MTEPDASLTSGVVRPLRQRLAFRFVTVAMALLILPDLIASKVNAVGTAMDWLTAGVYDVTTFVLKGDTIPVTSADSKRWRELIIDDARQHVDAAGQHLPLHRALHRARQHVRRTVDHAARQFTAHRAGEESAALSARRAPVPLVVGIKPLTYATTVVARARSL